ncbi:protein Mpv17 [Planococcus citri]|uniref:protein Mpv17 n=1 Tax=Planococcus citri TaxID=170843 RepID=UPI0031F8734A
MQSIRVFRYYQKLLHDRPYVVQSVQTVTLMSIGDIISQSCVEKKGFSQINYYRVAKFGSVGLVLGPALTSWYRFLDKLQFKSLKFVLVRKIAMDQMIFAPFAVGSITSLVSFFDGQTTQEVKQRLQADFFTILLNNYKLWPFVQYVNFSLVPLDYRVLVTQCVGVAWNTYLAWKLNAEKT